MKILINNPESQNYFLTLTKATHRHMPVNVKIRKAN